MRGGVGGGRVGGMRGGGGRVGGGMRGGGGRGGGRERFTMPMDQDMIRSEQQQETPDDFMGII